MKEQTVSGIYLGPTENFQVSYKIFSLNTSRVFTRNKKIREMTIPTWVIQCVEALVMCDRWDLAGSNEPLFFDRFANQNYFSAALHEGGITGVAQDDNDKYDDNEDGDIKTNEDPYKTPVISLDTTLDHRKIAGVPPKRQWNYQEFPHKKTQWNSQECPHQKTMWLRVQFAQDSVL